eukprot:8310756-Pyramimonas_sp.AAC.1
MVAHNSFSCKRASADQSDAGSVGIFSRRTNQTQEAWVYSHGRPIRRGPVGMGETERLTKKHAVLAPSCLRKLSIGKA